MNAARRGWGRWGLLAVLVGYLAAASAFAWFTPPWQAPDEPAHYNYIRHLAEGLGLPVLLPGDYPHNYLEALKAQRFPADLPIAPLRYEFHQPPLYYLLATPLYWLSGGSLLALRLFSAALGAALLAAVHRLAQASLPGRPAVALGATAFVAFLPMHLATSAAVNNDILAELCLAWAMLGLVRYLQADQAVQPARLTGLGLLIGLGLCTKTSAYILLPLSLGAVALRQARLTAAGGRPHPGSAWREAVALWGPALLLGALWWGRNLWVYGGADFLGLARHDAVVMGQLRTADWLAQVGWPAAVAAFAATTFRSFWGQFGWMGVLLDARLYGALAVLSAAVLGGAAAAAWRVGRAKRRARPKRWAMALLLGWLALNLLAYAWYNGQFVQHQGRYLFWALPVWGLAFAVGWAEMTARPPVARWGAAILGLAGLGLALVSASASALDKWGVALCWGGAAGLAVLSLLPAGLRRLAFWGLFAALWGVSLVCLLGFVVPALAG
ncbi:MAG: glycosyltransferase family 39 protein [Chloroflexi bacterium]|nr:glycosyltransferase family 39 protein [Chloroflexota bacterium]